VTNLLGLDIGTSGVRCLAVEPKTKPGGRTRRGSTSNPAQPNLGMVDLVDET
jgi:sugar (pentulose or hexulose) kinase